MADGALLIVVGLPARRDDRRLVVVGPDAHPATAPLEGLALGRYARTSPFPGALVDVYA